MKALATLFVSLLLIGTGAFCANEVTDTEMPGHLKDPIYISILNLVANPEKWDKKNVAFSGYGKGSGDTIVVSYANELLGKKLPCDIVVVRGGGVEAKASLMAGISPTPLIVSVRGTVQVLRAENGGIRGIFINDGVVDFEDLFETYSDLFEK
jgi:hypothetical protein